jgi:lipopolysaccharide cholinephosphotransferase
MAETELKSASLELHQQALLRLLREFDRVCREIGVSYQLFAGTLLGSVRHKGFIPWDDDLDILMMREDYEKFLSEAGRLIDSETFFLQKEFSEHWPLFFSKLRLNNTACIEKYRPRDPLVHQGIYIDIFPCDDARASRIGKRLQFFASKIVIAKSLDRRGYVTDSLKKKAFILACRVLPMKPFLAFAKKGKKNGAELHSFFAAARSYSKNLYPRALLENTAWGEFEGGTYPIPADYDILLKTLYGDYNVLPSPEERGKKLHAIFVDTENSYEKYLDLVKTIEFDVLTESIR